MTLGQRIQAERKRLGLSQEGLGEALGVTRQAISKWEADGAVPEVDTSGKNPSTYKTEKGVRLTTDSSS